MDRGRNAVAAAAMLAVGCSLISTMAGCGPAASGATSAENGAAVQLDGAGATFPEPIYVKWAGKYAELNDIRINYQPIGSGGGIAQVKARTVDFGASDAPLKPADTQQADLVQFPMVIGGVVPVVNLEGVAAGQLKLTPGVFVDILLGEIRRWDDPALTALNPALRLPRRDITVVYRSDPSGTTWIFTHYLASASAKWKDKVGADKGIDWPVGIAGKGNQGVATYVSRVKGAIGYVEFAYAKLAGMTTVSLKNRAGKFVQPTLKSFQGAALHADWTTAKNYYLILVNQPGEETWPITGASFLLVQRTGHEPHKLAAMLAFFNWCFSHGAELAEGLDYVPMPPEVVQRVRQTWRETWPEEAAALGGRAMNQQKLKTQSSAGDVAFSVATSASAWIIVLLMGGMLVLLAWNSRQAIERFGAYFLVSQEWDPVKKEFGAASSIYGTLMTTAIAMAIAAPLGLITALFLVEVAPPRVSRFVGGALELLAAIPSIIFGMWGFFVFVPLMADHVQPALGDWLGWLPMFSGSKHGLGILTAGIILALMVLPFVCAVSRDVLALVPPVMKESAYGLGATTWEVTKQVSLRYGLLGIAGGMFLGLGRAIGETMAVTFVIGSNHKLSGSLFDAGNTIASTLANEFAESERFSLHQSVLIELGLVLFAITLVFQVLAQLWLRRLRNNGGGRG